MEKLETDYSAVQCHIPGGQNSHTCVCVCEKMYHVFSIAEHNMVFNLHRNLKNKVTFFWGGIYSIMLLPVKQ